MNNDQAQNLMLDSVENLKNHLRTLPKPPGGSSTSKHRDVYSPSIFNAGPPKFTIQRSVNI